MFKVRTENSGAYVLNKLGPVKFRAEFEALRKTWLLRAEGVQKPVLLSNNDI